MKRTCKQCGKEFFISQQEINFYKEKKLSIPKRCKDCRNANKAAKEDSDKGTSNSETSNKGTSNKNEGAKSSSASNANTSNKNTKNTSNKNGQYKPDSVVKKKMDELEDKNNGCNSNEDKRGATDTKTSSSASGNSAKKPVSGVKKAIYSAAAVVVLAGSTIFGTNYYNSQQVEPTGYVTEAQVTFANAKLLNEHYEKHGKEMGFTSAAEYEKAAAKVVADSDALHKTEKEDGDDVYYLEATNEFVIVSKDTGYIRTYFKPDDGIDYFNRQ